MTTAMTTPARPNIRSRTGTTAVAGVDIGAHSAKLVIVRRHGNGWCVVRAHCLPLAATALASADELARVLRPWLKKHGEQHCRDLVLSLPSRMVDYESVELPADSGESLATRAREAMQRLLGDELPRAAYDYWVGGPSGADSTGMLHLAWTASEFAGSLSANLARDRWRCLAIDAPGAALARVATEGEAAPGNQLAVDIGVGEASLVWCRGGVAEYVRNRIRFASDSAVGFLSREMGVRAAAVEKLLASWGVGESRSGSSATLEEMLLQRLSEWLQRLNFEVKRTLHYLQHRHRRSVVSEVVLCGGGACIRGLDHWLEERLGLPVRMARIPGACYWHAAEPYSPLYALATVLARQGGLP